MKRSIAEVLETKRPGVYGVEINATVAQAAALMADKRIGSVLVNKGDHVVGILTERDLAWRCVLGSRIDTGTTAVSDVMTSPVAHVTPDTTTGEALKLMSDTGCRHLPVLVEEKVVGVIAIGDLLRFVTDELEYQVNCLETYIRGY